MIKIETIDDINRLIAARDSVTRAEFAAVLRETIKASDDYICHAWIMWLGDPLAYMRSRSPISQGEALLSLVIRKMEQMR